MGGIYIIHFYLPLFIKVNISISLKKGVNICSEILNFILLTLTVILSGSLEEQIKQLTLWPNGPF